MNKKEDSMSGPQKPAEPVTEAEYGQQMGEASLAWCERQLNHPALQKYLALRDAKLEAQAADAVLSDVEGLAQALEEAAKGLGGFLWMGNNLHNVRLAPDTFVELYRSAMDDGRKAYDKAQAALIQARATEVGSGKSWKRGPCVHGNPCRERDCVEYGRWIATAELHGAEGQIALARQVAVLREALEQVVNVHRHAHAWSLVARVVEDVAVPALRDTEATAKAHDAEIVKPWREAFLDAYHLLPPDRADLIQPATEAMFTHPLMPGHPHALLQPDSEGEG